MQIAHIKLIIFAFTSHTLGLINYSFQSHPAPHDISTSFIDIRFFGNAEKKKFFFYLCLLYTRKLLNNFFPVYRHVRVCINTNAQHDKHFISTVKWCYDNFFLPSTTHSTFSHVSVCLFPSFRNSRHFSISAYTAHITSPTCVCHKNRWSLPRFFTRTRTNVCVQMCVCVSEELFSIF